jgi:hypothetical protein
VIDSIAQVAKGVIMNLKCLSATILFLGFLVIITTDIYAVENLIMEEDFEAGHANWAVATRPGAAMELSIDDEEFVTGEKSARIEVSAVGGGGMHDLTLDCQIPIGIEANEPYTVDFWVKAEEDRTIAIDLLMNHDPWTNAFREENIPVTTEWAVQHHTFTAIFDDENMIFLFSFSRASNLNPLVTMWIDHIRFYEGDFEEEDLLGQPPKAVTFDGKLTGTWGMIKSGN